MLAKSATVLCRICQISDIARCSLRSILPLTCHLPGRESRSEELTTVRIPLDYYRILSVPVKATSEQLQQAYSDRLQQRPRREYSERAVKARQELIKHSYQVLSDLEQRASYDAQFLINMQPKQEDAAKGEAEVIEESGSVTNPTIDIPGSHLVGALLILQEQGEYETVLKIGIDRFNQTIAQESLTTELDDDGKDLILSLVLAYLELGREQWQREEYEDAAVSGKMGVDLLNRQGLFPHLKEELELDLHKLCFYRILELISQNPVHSAARTKGFKLLRSMLIQRRGIEGKGTDPCGWNFERFLSFIQQLRTYLTSAEQQQLFDDESQSDSAVATYLAVYALLGRGFCLKQPELIIRAQRKLDSLSEKQDVSWEQTVTALLLGHTEKAIHKLNHAPDLSRLELVLQYDPNNSDLLPGLCFYSEQWLLKDVVAQFNDLSTTRLTLQEYFADRQVQIYLEELASPTPGTTTVAPQPVKQAHPSSKHQSEKGTGILSRWCKLLATQKPAAFSQKAVAARRESLSQANGNGAHPKRSQATTIVEGDRHRAVSKAKKFSSTTIEPSPKPRQQSRPARKSPSLPLHSSDKTRAVPPSVMQKAQKAASRGMGRKTSASPWRSRLLYLSLIVGGGVLGMMAIGRLLFAPEVRTAKGTQLAIAITQPTVKLPPKAQPVAARPQLTFAEKSRQTVETWLASKSAAFGKQHQIGELNNILAEPLLTTWRDRASAYQQDNTYRDYEHQLTVRSAKVDPNNSERATVEAEVREVAKHYQAGQLDDTLSYDDNLLVRYQLVRQGEKWLIQNSEVLETLN